MELRRSIEPQSSQRFELLELLEDNILRPNEYDYLVSPLLHLDSKQKRRRGLSHWVGVRIHTQPFATTQHSSDLINPLLGVYRRFPRHH